MIEVKEINYESFGKCVCITNGEIEAYVTIDFGPRIIRCGFVGGENFMKEDKGPTIEHDLGEDCIFKENKFYIRGGHRFWISPEAMPRTYYPDNEPVAYEKTANGAIFTPPVQVVNDFAFTIEISMDENENKITIDHHVKNVGYWPKEFAPWCITVMAEGGVEVLPQNTTDTGLLSNRTIMLWPYTKINDERFTVTDKYMTLRQDPTVEHPFKVGISQEHPWAAYFRHGCMFVKTYSPVDGGVYPDNNCTYETYTNDKILEMESLGELKTVNSGETSSHTEVWYLYENVDVPDTDEEKDALKAKYNLK